MSNDPQFIWQNQNTEEIKMALAYFKVKAEEQRRKNVQVAVVSNVATVFAVLVLGFAVMRNPSWMAVTGLALFVAGALYILYRKRTQPATPLETPPASGLEAYRRELLRWRENKRQLGRGVTPLLPGSLLMAIHYFAPVVRAAAKNPAILVNALPFFILLALWLALIVPVRNRQLKKIQQELDALGA